MNPDEHFTRTVSVLPDAVRERLDGDFPLDWAVLEDAATGAGVGKAIRVRHRLPEAVELLVNRLVADVGIVPADLAAGVERQGFATAWIHWVTIEADGESYLLRNDRTGDVHTGVGPEAVAGYATLGMELATAVHEAVERWLEAGRHHRASAEDERSRLAQCAARMHAHLHESEAISGPRPTARLARTLELAWNTQSVEERAALAGIRLSTARGACAPRRSHYAPVSGFRLHACDAGEIRWLRALAERAGAGIGVSSLADLPEGAPHVSAADERTRVEHEGATDPEIVPEGTAAGTLELGSDAARLKTPDTQVAELLHAVNQVPGAVRRRLGETHGAGVAEGLERFRSPQAVDALRSSLERTAMGRNSPIPRWLEKLAAALLVDAGAQTRDGVRTASVRLDPRRRPDGGYLGTETPTGAVGHLAPAGLVEQVRLGFAYAHAAWTGLTALGNAGKEGEWALSETVTADRPLSASQREMLEAAREIGRALERIRRARADVHGQRPPNALEQAAMAAEALATVGPTVRTAAGWPGAAGAPDARDPEDVARIAEVAQRLHGDIRAVANRLIAGWVAEVPPYGANQNA